jgi:hypothetical protein
MIKLLDILKETMYVHSDNELNDIYDWQVIIDDGEIVEDENNTIEGIFVQIEYFNPEEEEYTDIGEYPNPKKYVASGDLEEYAGWLGAGLWTKDPLEIYKGDGDWEPLGHKYYGYQFDTFEEVEDFMKNHLKDKLRYIYK